MGIGRFTWGSPRFTTLVDNGPPANRLDVAILGDGYAAADMPLFHQDVDAIVRAFHEFEPMASYIRHFNFHRIDVISQQSGVDDRWSKPPVKVKSALGAHFSILNERRLVGWDWRVKQVAWRSGAPHDSLLVVVNTPRRGGATRFWMTVGYASRNSSDFPNIMIHEAGHSIAKLMDEYDYSLPALARFKGRSIPLLRLPFANVDTRCNSPKWSCWVEPETPLPTAPDPDRRVVGAFEGASYTQYGVYKPTADCMMRRHSQPFCPVCQEQWIKRIYRRSRPADRFSPEAGVRTAVGAPLTFAAELVRPDGAIHAVWDVQGSEEGRPSVPAAALYQPWTTAFDRPGEWTVSLTLIDRDPKVRHPAVTARATQHHTWRVRVLR